MSKGNSCFGADGTMGVKLHKKLEDTCRCENRLFRLVRWGEASDFASIYGVASKDFKINNKDGLLSLGIELVAEIQI